MNSIRSGYRLFAWPYWWRHWFSPRTYYYWMKYKIQRAQRGWADCDTWSLDHYLAYWMPDALLHLKENKHGVPGQMFTEADCDTDGNPTDAAMELRGHEWDAIIDKMIEAFRAHIRIHDLAHAHEKELGPWPMCRKKGHFLCDCEPWRELASQYMENQKPLVERDQKIFDEGMALFSKHFGSLWD